MPITPLLPTGWPTPTPQLFEGQYCRLEPLNPTTHGDQLYEAISGPDTTPAATVTVPGRLTSAPSSVRPARRRRCGREHRASPAMST